MARVLVAIFAHNEERRIARCISSLPLRSDAFEFHVLVNGTTDRTIEIARRASTDAAHFHIHALPLAGKARTWNHFVDAIFAEPLQPCIFIDGDVEIMPGALQAMTATLAANRHANGVNALPVTGRRQSAYRNSIIDEHGIFGALYGLSGDFMMRLKTSAIRLPRDLIGDDSLIGALAKTDLQNERHWQKTRIANCPAAEFAFEEIDWRAPRTWGLQYRRAVNYSVRRYQNIIISQIMRGPGPHALPATLRETYAAHWHLFDIRPRHIVFDMLAKQRMKHA